MSLTRDHIEKGICLLWAVYLLQLVSGPHRFEGIYNSLIITTAVLIPILWGWGWLKRYEIRWIALGAVIYVLSLSVSALVAEPWPAGVDAIREFPGKGGLVLFSLLFLFRRRENWIWFMWGIAGSLVIALFLGYYNLLTPEAMNLTVNPTAEQFPGSISILHYHKNEYGSFLMYTVPLLSGFALLLFHQSETETRSGWAFLTILAVALPMVFLTKSRSAQAAVPVGMAFPALIFILKSRYRQTLLTACATGLLLILALLFMTDLGPSTLDRWTEKNVMTLNGRTNKVWPKFYRIAMERPYFGHGLQLEKKFDLYFNHEHSIYLAHLTRAGWIGLAGYCFFLLLAFMTALKRMYQDPITAELLLFLAFLASVLTGTILEGIVAPIRWPQLYIITFSGLIASGCLSVHDKSSDQA